VPTAVEIAIVDAELADLPWPLRFANALELLTAARAREPRVAFAETDIDQWDWEAQAITLSVPATGRLVAALPREAELDPSARAIKRMHDELRWGNAIGLALQGRGFLVSLRRVALYGGMFVEAVSERAIEIPVARTALAGGRATMSILPVHLPFLIRDPGSRDADVSIDDIAPESRGDWPVVSSLWRSAFGAEAARLRLLIRDAQLRAAVDAAGKLSR
jgi:hypothetical protein